MHPCLFESRPTKNYYDNILTCRNDTSCHCLSFVKHQLVFEEWAAQLQPLQDRKWSSAWGWEISSCWTPAVVSTVLGFSVNLVTRATISAKKVTVSNVLLTFKTAHESGKLQDEKQTNKCNSLKRWCFVGCIRTKKFVTVYLFIYIFLCGKIHFYVTL